MAESSAVEEKSEENVQSDGENATKNIKNLNIHECVFAAAGIKISFYTEFAGRREQK